MKFGFSPSSNSIKLATAVDSAILTFLLGEKLLEYEKTMIYRKFKNVLGLKCVNIDYVNSSNNPLELDKIKIANDMSSNFNMTIILKNSKNEIMKTEINWNKKPLSENSFHEKLLCDFFEDVQKISTHRIFNILNNKNEQFKD